MKQIWQFEYNNFLTIVFYDIVAYIFLFFIYSYQIKQKLFPFFV